jgi:hypothetical protein
VTGPARRAFIAQLLFGAVALAARHARAEADPGRVREDDPAAHSQGFRTDTTQVDEARYPRHSAGQRCGECQMFCARADGQGACSFYDGRLVPANGWCRNFAAITVTSLSAPPAVR